MISLTFGRVWSTFLIFWNFSVVPPLQVQVSPVVPPLVLSENFEIVQNVFLWLEDKFYNKKIVLDDFSNVWKFLKRFFNLKFSCGLLFPSAIDACGPPFDFERKFLNLTKRVFGIQNNYFY